MRGSGSIGQRHARVFRQVGADVSLWPVRERGRAGVPDEGSMRGPALDCSATAPDLPPSETPSSSSPPTPRVTSPTPSRRSTPAPTRSWSRSRSPRPPTTPTCCTSIVDAQPSGWRRRCGHTPPSVTCAASSAGSSRAARRTSGRSRGCPTGDPTVTTVSPTPPRADEGGVLRDLVHEIDYATVLFGPPTPAGRERRDRRATRDRRRPGGDAAVAGRPLRRGDPARLPHPTGHARPRRPLSRRRDRVGRRPRRRAAHDTRR